MFKNYLYKNLWSRIHHSIFILYNFLDYITEMKLKNLCLQFVLIGCHFKLVHNQNITILSVYNALSVWHHKKKSWSDRNWRMSYHSESSIQLGFFSIQIKIFFNCLPLCANSSGLPGFLGKYLFSVLVRALMFI